MIKKNFSLCVRTSEPNARESAARSTDAVSGITVVHGYPRLAAITPSPIPVLPYTLNDGSEHTVIIYYP